MGRRRKQKTRTGRKQGARCAVEKDAVHIVDVGLTMESEATSGSDTLATMMKQVKLQCVERGESSSIAKPLNKGVQGNNCIRQRPLAIRDFPFGCGRDALILSRDVIDGYRRVHAGKAELQKLLDEDEDVEELLEM